MKPYDYGVPSLYAGQTVSAEDIYCLLDTYVIGSDMVTYYWDADAYDKYVRVTGISYDNGKTWIKDFPVTLPEDVSDLNVVIRTEYRFSQKSAWREYLVPYTVEQVRFFLLSEQIKEENATIDSSAVLNEDQYPTVGSEENLFSYQKTKRAACSLKASRLACASSPTAFMICLQRTSKPAACTTRCALKI